MHCSLCIMRAQTAALYEKKNIYIFFSYRTTNNEWIFSTKNELNPTLCAAFFKIQNSRVNNTVPRHILYSICSLANEMQAHQRTNALWGISARNCDFTFISGT